MPPLSSLPEQDEVEEQANEVFDLAAQNLNDFGTEIYDLAAPKGCYFELRSHTAAKLSVRDKSSSGGGSGGTWHLSDVASPSNSDVTPVGSAAGVDSANTILAKQRKFVKHTKNNKSYRSHRSAQTVGGSSQGSKSWGGSTWGQSLNEMIKKTFGGSTQSLNEYMDPSRRDRRRVFNWYRREVQQSTINVYTREDNKGVSMELSRLLGAREKTPHFILHPYGQRRMAWECISMVFLFYSMVVVPVKLCFDFDKDGCSKRFDQQLWHWYTDLAVDFAFMLDVLVNLRTAYVEENQTATLETSAWKIFLRYARGFLLIDIISAVPVDLILMGYCDNTSADSANNILRAPTLVRRLRMLRLTRLLRLKRFREFLERMRDSFQINPGFLRLLKFALLVLITTHYNGCIFFFIGETAVNEANPRLVTWTTNEFFFSTAHGGEVAVHEMSIAEQYWVSLYWSVTTMTTVGFGDITPVTTAEVVFCILIIIEGGAALGYVIGSLADMVSRLNKRRREYRDKMEYWDDVFFRGRFPQELRQKIRRYHEWMFLNNISKLPSFAEEELSKSLLMNIVSHIYRDHLRSVPLFRDFSDDALTHLALALEHIQVPPGEIIYKEGEPGDSMMFLQRGDVQFSVLLMPKPRKAVLGQKLVQGTIDAFAQHVRRQGLHHMDLPNDEKAAFFCWHMHDRNGCVFGESVLFSSSDTRLSTASSCRGCIVLRLTAAALKHLSGKVPEMGAVIKKMEHTKQPRLKTFSRSIIQINRVLKCDVPRLQVTVHGAVELPRMDQFTGRCDPYCLLDVGAHWKQNRVRSRTLVVYNTYAPSWDETFSFHLSDYSAMKPVEVNFTVMDWDQLGNHDFVGEVTIDLRADVRKCMESKLETQVGPKWLNLKKDERHVRGHRKRISKLKVSFKIFPPVSTHKLNTKFSDVSKDTLKNLWTQPATSLSTGQPLAPPPTDVAATPGQPLPSLEEEAELYGREYDSTVDVGGGLSSIAVQSMLDRGRVPPALVGVASVRSGPAPSSFASLPPVASEPLAPNGDSGATPDVASRPPPQPELSEIREISPPSTPARSQPTLLPVVPVQTSEDEGITRAPSYSAWEAADGAQEEEEEGGVEAVQQSPLAASPLPSIAEHPPAQRRVELGGVAGVSVPLLREKVKAELGRLRKEKEALLVDPEELHSSATEAWTALEAVLGMFETETDQAKQHAQQTRRMLRNMSKEIEIGGDMSQVPDVAAARQFAAAQVPGAATDIEV